MPENISLKRFNYKISRQISCPYGGSPLIAQCSWVMQLSFHTVYLYWKKTWRDIDVMHRFRLKCVFVDLKLVVRQTISWKDHFEKKRTISSPWQNNIFSSAVSEKPLAGPRQPRRSSDISSETECTDSHHFPQVWKKKIGLKGGKKISGFHWIPEGPRIKY